MTTSYNDFIGEVQHRIEAGRQSEAVRMTRAVLTTLGERVEEGGATDIAGALPMEIDWYILQADHGQQFDFDEFIDRVQARLSYEDLDLDTDYGRPSEMERADVVFNTQAVVALLSEAVPGGVLANVEEQLPEDYEDLFKFVDVETKPWEQREA